MNRLQRIVTPTLGLVLLTIGPACSHKDIRSSDSGGMTDTASAHRGALAPAHTSNQGSDLRWHRMWLGELDASYRNARGGRTGNFPSTEYSQAQVEQAFGHTIYDAGIFFGRS